MGLWMVGLTIVMGALEAEKEFIRSHLKLTLSFVSEDNQLCWGYRYRDELGSYLSQLLNVTFPEKMTESFTLTEEACEKLLDFSVDEAANHLNFFLGNLTCLTPRMALADLFHFARPMRVWLWGSFKNSIVGRDWSRGLDQRELDNIRHTMWCMTNEAHCEDVLNLFSASCPNFTILTTPAGKRPLPRPPDSPSKAELTFPWERYTYKSGY